MDDQKEFIFPTLDFEGRVALTVDECARKLHCTPKHVLDLIDEERLLAIDISGAGNKSRRRTCRVPVEAWRDFLLKSATGPYDHSPLKQLPTASLIKLYQDIRAHLRQKGISPKP